MCFLNTSLIIPKPLAGKTEKQYKLMKESIERKGSRLPCLQAPLALCVQECMHLSTAVLKCKKHQESH